MGYAYRDVRSFSMSASCLSTFCCKLSESEMGLGQLEVRVGRKPVILSTRSKSRASYSLPPPSCPQLGKQKSQNSVCDAYSASIILKLTYNIYSSLNPPRLLQTHPELKQHACRRRPVRKHRMGKGREAHILKTQFGESLGLVRMYVYSVLFSCSLPLAHLCRKSQLESLQFKPVLALIDMLLTELNRLNDMLVLTGAPSAPLTHRGSSISLDFSSHPASQKYTLRFSRNRCLSRPRITTRRGLNAVASSRARCVDRSAVTRTTSSDQRKRSSSSVWSVS